MSSIPWLGSTSNVGANIPLKICKCPVCNCLNPIVPPFTADCCCDSCAVGVHANMTPEDWAEIAALDLLPVDPQFPFGLEVAGQ